MIDPGRAFGTGAHATTRLCLELLLGLAPAGGAGASRSVVDLGCGSGVLAIAAAKLGWAPVLALDYDPLSVEATAARTRPSTRVTVEVRRFDLRDAGLPAGRARAREPARAAAAELGGAARSRRPRSSPRS